MSDYVNPAVRAAIRSHCVAFWGAGDARGPWAIQAMLLLAKVVGSVEAAPDLRSEEDNCGHCRRRPLVVFMGRCTTCGVSVPEHVLSRCK